MWCGMWGADNSTHGVEVEGRTSDRRRCTGGADEGGVEPTTRRLLPPIRRAKEPWHRKLPGVHARKGLIPVAPKADGFDLK
jgi:hypothetical protein